MEEMTSGASLMGTEDVTNSICTGLQEILSVQLKMSSESPERDAYVHARTGLGLPKNLEPLQIL